MDLPLAINVALALKELRAAQENLADAKHQLHVIRNNRKRMGREDALDAVYYANKRLNSAEENADRILAELDKRAAQ